MELRELKKFYDMVLLYDQVGDGYIHEQEDIDRIIKLGDNRHFEAINDVYNEDYEASTADELMLEHFGHDTESLNKLADEYGYTRVNEVYINV